MATTTGKAYIINTTNQSLFPLLNQGNPMQNLVSLTVPTTGPVGNISGSTWIVDFNTSEKPSGALGQKDNILQLTGQQFNSMGSPIFNISMDPTEVDPNQTSVLIWVFFNSIVCTDSHGNTKHIIVTAENSAAQPIVQNSPNRAPQKEG